jgi:hypothetical protein
MRLAIVPYGQVYSGVTPLANSCRNWPCSPLCRPMGVQHARRRLVPLRGLARSPVADRREPRAGRGLYVRQQVQFALDVAGPGPDHLTDRHYAPACGR